MANRSHVRIRKRVLQTERMVGRTNDQNVVVKADECPEVGRGWFMIQKVHLQMGTEPFLKIRIGASGDLGTTLCVSRLCPCVVYAQEWWTSENSLSVMRARAIGWHLLASSYL